MILLGLGICGSDRLESLPARREDDAFLPPRPLFLSFREGDHSLSSLPEIESYWTDGKFKRDTIIPDIGRSETCILHAHVMRGENFKFSARNFSCGASGRDVFYCDEYEHRNAKTVYWEVAGNEIRTTR